MKFDSILKSNHDLKKNGYKILRKLHKLEKKSGADRAYAIALEDSFFWVCHVKHLLIL